MSHPRPGIETSGSEPRPICDNLLSPGSEQRVAPGRTSYCIGLTGNIATGKSTVGRMLVALGAELIDADKVAHAVMAPTGGAYAGVVAAFGAGIVDAAGVVDRRALGRIVFADSHALERLESLVHPAVLAEVDRRIERSTAPVVVIEAIKLLESGMADAYDAVWVTACPESQQLARLMETRGLSEEDAWARIRAQASQAEKVARADVVIDTAGTLAVTRAQVESAWVDLRLCLDA